MTIRQWSTTASGNANAASINWQEGQAPSTVNNSARELMAQIRQEYDPERWGWIAFSATVSVASQTTFKITGNQTDDYVANRKVKLTGGTATVYADILSASFTSETTVTIQNASGSLSNSMSIAWLSAVYGNNLPGNVVTGSGTATLSALAVLGSASFSASVHFTGPVEFKGAFSVSGAAAFRESVSFSASAKFLGAVAFTGGGTVTSATLSVAAGMLTVGGSPVGVGSGGTTILNNTAPTTAGATFSGSWSAYSAFEIAIGMAFTPLGVSSGSTTLSVGVALYSDGGTTPFLTGTIAQIAPSAASLVNVWTTVKVAGGASTNVVIYPGSSFISTKDVAGFNARPTATSSSGALYINAIRVWAVHNFSGTLSFTSTGRVIITGS